MIVFEPLTDFFSEAFDSHYLTGLRYTVRPGNDRLAHAAEQWRAEGKVIFVPSRAQHPSAVLGGTGKVGVS